MTQNRSSSYNQAAYNWHYNVYKRHAKGLTSYMPSRCSTKNSKLLDFSKLKDILTVLSIVVKMQQSWRII